MIQSSHVSTMCVVFCDTSNFASFTRFTRFTSLTSPVHSLHSLHSIPSLPSLASLHSLHSIPSLAPLASLHSLNSLHSLHLHVSLASLVSLVSLALLASLTSLASAAAPQLQWYSQDDRVTQALYGHAPPGFGVAENESTGFLTTRNGSHSIFLYFKLLPLAALILFAAATEAETLQLNSNSCLHRVILGMMLVSY